MLHQVGSPVALGLARITVFGIWMVSIGLRPIELYSELPKVFFNPVGPFHFLPPEIFAFALNANFLVGLKVVLTALCGLLVLGIRPFIPLAVFTSALLLFYDFLMKGFNSYPNHDLFGVLYAALVLSLFRSSDGLSVLGPPKEPAPAAHYSAPMLAVALLLAASYSFIGTHRLVVNGPDIFTGDAILTLLAIHSFDGGAIVDLPLGFPWLASFLKLGYFVTTVFEVLSPLVLFYRLFRWAWLLIIVSFHVTTFLTMNIFFWENILLILVFLTPLGYHFAQNKAPLAFQTATNSPVQGPKDS